MRRFQAGLALLGAALPGASAEVMETSNVGETAGLDDTAWQVEDIDERGIVDRSMITLEFTGDGRVTGSTGCNRYVGHVYLDGDVLTVSGIGSTRRACVPALIDQERRFLAALESAASYAHDEAGRLLIADGAGARRLVAVELAGDPTAGPGTRSQPDG